MTLSGERLAICGTGLRNLTASVIAFDGPPLASCVKTCTGIEPGALTSAAKMIAFNCFELTKSVARVLLLNCTTELVLKFDPFTVNVNTGAFTATSLGLISEIEGGDELTDTIGSVTSKPNWFETPPPGDGLNTVIFSVVATARSCVDSVILKVVPFTKVVERDDPLMRAAEVWTKFDPLITN